MAVTRLIGMAVALAVLVIDQLLKYIVAVPLDLSQRGQIVITSFFNLTWTENRGVSLGLLTADTHVGRWLLVAFTAAIALGVTVWMLRERSRSDVIALGAILGGALGNIIDRVRFGYVVDFADLHFGAFRPFLVFNAADAAITLGVVMLLARAFLGRDKVKEPIDA